MTLTLGGHHVVTGAGQFAIAQPVGLVVSIAGITNYVSRDTPTPVRYKQLAFINVGNALGWQPRIAIEHIPQIFYPIEPEFTLLRHNLLAGETATIDEIATSTTLVTRPMPWDRSLTSVLQNYYNNVSGASSITLWTYTVPVGRRLMITSADVRLIRNVVATSTDTCVLGIDVSGTPIVSVTKYGNTNFDERSEVLGPGGLIIPAGYTARATYSCTDVAGRHLVAANLTGYSFDA